MDYSQLDEVEIPKRNDRIYKEIESFEDYELTRCIVYEMAIRSGEDFRYVDEYEEWDFNQEDHYLLSDISLLGYFTLADKITEIYPTYIEDTHKKAFDIFKKQYNPAHYSEEILKQMYSQAQNYYFNQIANNLTYFIDNFLMNTNKEFIPITVPTLSEDVTIDKNYLIDIIKQTNKPQHIPIIRYNRPEVTSNLSKVISLNINMALPLNELIAQITKIKKEFEGNQQKIKTTVELLGKKFQEVQSTKGYPKKPKAEKYADMFFIYDYVTARHKEIKKYNALRREEYEAELLAIKNNTDLSTKEKREQTKQALKHYKEMKSDATLKDICHEDELTEQLDIQGEMIYKNYRIMKPYIEDMKYKELVTGVQAE